MTPGAPSGDDIRAMLREGHFGDGGDLPAADPITPTQMWLEIERIIPYDRNPRRERNALYDEIKESIRAQGGLNTPLTITRRPGEALFMVEAGGNTRLQILHELWRETQDECFHRVHCLFHPWKGEIHVLTAHLIENDKRGALTFIDKALGVRALRELLEDEREQSLSQHELADTLRDRGYGLDQSMISRMEYAVEVLLPLIPEALRAGMGTPQIRRIRRLEGAAQGLWNDQKQPPEAFAALFGEVLAAHDGPSWTLEAPQRALEGRLSEELSLPLKTIRLEIDARLNRGPEGRASSPPVSSPRSEGHSILVTENAMASDGDGRLSDEMPSPSPHEGSASNSSQPSESPAVSPSEPAESATGAIEPPFSGGPYDIKSLRSRGYVLALKIAQRHDLADCVLPAAALGMGFLVDLPRDAILPAAGQADTLSQLCRQWVWWLLLSLSEEAVIPERMAQAPEDLLLRNLILEGNDAKALALVGEPDWKAIGYELVSNPVVPSDTIEDLLALMRTCRQLRQAARDQEGSALWPTSS